MAITKEQITDRLRLVNDPELHRDIVSLGMLKNVAYCDGVARITIELTTPACPLKDTLQKDVEAALKPLGPELQKVTVEFTAQVKKAPQAQAGEANPLPGVKNIIAVGAGKGGVGKSTVSVNLAVGLARAGASVGLLDGDIYGPSIPTLLGIDRPARPGSEPNTLAPFELHGIKAMTVGALVDPEKPLIWRGPMAHGAFKQLATQTQWGELDYLVIDLPPGTGDVALTMAQTLPICGAVIVCTPQKVAQDDARRAIHMFQQLQIEVLGVVENMSYFIGDDAKEYDIFGRGGAEDMATQMKVPFLGTIPIHMALRVSSDAGNPTANFETSPKLAGELEAVVKAVAGRIAVRAAEGAFVRPSISVS